jgi:hypothetical protein
LKSHLVLKRNRLNCGCRSVVEHVLSIFEAVGLIPSIVTKKFIIRRKKKIKVEVRIEYTNVTILASATVVCSI